MLLIRRVSSAFLLFLIAVTAFGQPIPPDLTYNQPYRYLSNTLRTDIPGKVVEVRSSVFDSGRIVQLYDRYQQNGLTSGRVQEWITTPAGRVGGTMTYFLVNREYEKYLDARTDNGAVTVRTGDNSDFQRWFQLELGNRVTFMNVATNSVLARSDTTNGSVFVLRTLTFADSQRYYYGDLGYWLFTTFMNGTSAQTYPSQTIACAENPAFQISASAPQSFSLMNSSTISNGSRRWTSYYPGAIGTSVAYGYVEERSTGLQLGSLGSQVPGTPIGATFPAWPTVASRQLWYVFNSKNSGEYYIVNAESGLALTANSPLVQGAGMTVQPIGVAGARQRWRFDQP